LPSSHAIRTQLYAGTSGWAYASWKLGFYPAAVPAKKFLQHYSSQLNSVEVNYTFRALPTASMIENWLAATPQDFRFSFKAPQRITHIRRLKESERDLEAFIAALMPVQKAGRLGLLLFQLPPNFKIDLARIAGFLTSPALKSQRIAFEFRNDTWFTPELFALLRQHNAALCVAESDDLITPDEQTASHLCYRLRRSNYTAKQARELAAKFSTLARKHDTFVYFKHEDDPANALLAASMLQQARALTAAKQ